MRYLCSALACSTLRPVQFPSSQSPARSIPYGLQGKTRHWTLISLSAWCLQAPQVYSLHPLLSDGGSSRKIQGRQFGHICGNLSKDGGEERNQPDLPSLTAHTLCPLVACGCRTRYCQCSRTVVAPPTIALFDPLCILLGGPCLAW